MRPISDVPSRSLLSRLTDHYMQIIANRAPVRFEAELDNPHGQSICYRGILMPFSSDGDTIDFIYGVINWKRVDGALQPVAFEAPATAIAGPESDGPEVDALLELTDVFETEPNVSLVADPLELDTPVTAGVEPEPEPQLNEQQSAVAATPVHFSWEDGPLADEDEVPVLDLDEDAGLADRLWAARETAESVKAGEGRTRAALYKALSLAYDFAVAAQQHPEDYAELLKESGVKAQVRAPMTPIVKLVFGIDYDKARLTEFAAALSYAQRQQVELGAFETFIEKQPGGLKGLVAAERQARRPDAQPDTKGEVARARLRAAPSISLLEVPTDEEFAVVLTRRGAEGTHEPVAIVEDQALLERAIRQAS